MYACKNCGGALRFDTTRQMLLCDNCDSSFLPTDFDIEQDAEEGIPMLLPSSAALIAVERSSRMMRRQRGSVLSVDPRSY